MARPNFGEGTLVFEDQFSYSDGSLSTVGSTKWTNGYWTGQPSLRVVSNKAAGPAADGWSDNYTLVDIPVSGGIDIIARGVVASPSNQNACMIHFFGSPGSSPSGYILHFEQRAGLDYIAWYELTNGTFSVLREVQQAWTDGDDAGIRILEDGTGQLYHRPAAGSWATVGATATDTTRTTGRLAMEMYDDVTRIDGIEVRSAADIPAGGSGGGASKRMMSMMGG